MSQIQKNVCLKLLKTVLKSNKNNLPRHFSTTIETEDEKNSTKSTASGFAKAFAKYTAPEPEAPPKESLPFPTLLRNSKFIDLGEPEDKIVSGKIFHIVDNDLYVDFGWKFHCVVTRPQRNGNAYVRGAIVRLKIKSLELSTRFLGSPKDLTILEADCILLGLIFSPYRSSQTFESNVSM